MKYDSGKRKRGSEKWDSVVHFRFSTHGYLFFLEF